MTTTNALTGAGNRGDLLHGSPRGLAPVNLSASPHEDLPATKSNPPEPIPAEASTAIGKKDDG